MKWMLDNKLAHFKHVSKYILQCETQAIALHCTLGWFRIIKLQSF